jgi:hypothetical protein
MTTDVKRVLVAFGFVFILKSIATERAVVLLFSGVSLQLFGRLKPLRLLWTTVTHEHFLKLGAALLRNLHLSRAGA